MNGANGWTIDGAVRYGNGTKYGTNGVWATMNIFNIQRYSLHDGPGTRTTVFLKGCPLRCAWCHNPESQSPQMECGVDRRRCLGAEQCGDCITVCPVSLNPLECTGCGKCAAVCPTGARERIGRVVRTRELLDRLLRDEILYRNGGGVTFSGGEPLSQSPELRTILDLCREYEIHTAVDTCGEATETVAMDVFQRTDLVLYDLKSVDDERHRWGPGRSNARILANFRRLIAIAARRGTPDVWVRIPVIPTFNADRESLSAIAAFVAECIQNVPTEDRERARERLQRVSLLPYHRLGRDKAQRLSRRRDEERPPWPVALTSPTYEQIQNFADRIFRPYGWTVD